MELFPYQVEGARFLAEKKRALLADEMGLGKTAQAIAATALLDLKTPTILVVCPASLRENWKREFEKFWPVNRDDGYRLYVESYDKLARAGRHSLLQAGGLHYLPSSGNLDVLILDEAHYLKTRTSKRTKAIFGAKCDGVGGLVEHAKHVFCLTGTPTPNNPSELWPMLRAVMPRSIPKLDIKAHGPDDDMDLSDGVFSTGIADPKPLTYWQFVERYCVTRDNGFGIQIVRGKNLDELKRRISRHVLRRKKDEVLKDLPPIRFDTLAVEGKLELSKDEKDATWAVAKILDEKGVAGLKEIAPHVASLRRVTGLAKVEGAVEWMADYFEGGGKKLVVFAHHREVMARLVEGFLGEAPGRRTSTSYAQITGDTQASLRQTMVDRFQNDPNCLAMFGQIQAAGTGITLTAASDVLFVESSWVPADNEQAAMRVHRIGQRNACLIRFAMLAGSLDEQIQRAVMRKTEDISKLFG